MKSNFQKIILFLSLILLVFFCFSFLFLYKAINDNNKKTEQDMVKWQIETRKRENIISLDNSLQKLQDDRAKLETHFAKSSDVVPFLDTIEKLAPTVGAVAAVDSVNTGVGLDKAVLMVGLKASGSFEAVYKFLTLLENSPYELDFVSMDIHMLAGPDTADKNVGNSKWEAVFKIKLLSFIP